MKKTLLFAALVGIALSSFGDMFGRLVPSSSWSYDKTTKVLSSHDGWTLIPSLKGDVLELEFKSFKSRARDSLELDTTGIYNALSDGQFPNLGSVKCLRFASGQLRGFNRRVKRLLVDAGEWIERIDGDCLDGNSLSILEELIVSSARQGGLSLGKNVFANYPADATALAKIAIKARKVTIAAGAFSGVDGADVYWSCPPPASAANVFASCKSIRNFVPKNQTGWASVPGVTGIPGTWKSDSETEIDYFDFVVDEGAWTYKDNYITNPMGWRLKVDKNGYDLTLANAQGYAPSGTGPFPLDLSTKITDEAGNEYHIVEIPGNYNQNWWWSKGVGVADKIGSLKLPETLRTIGPRALSNLTNARGDLVIPNSVTSIGGNAYDFSGFDGQLIVGEGLTTFSGPQNGSPNPTYFKRLIQYGDQDIFVSGKGLSYCPYIVLNTTGKVSFTGASPFGGGDKTPIKDGYVEIHASVVTWYNGANSDAGQGCSGTWTFRLACDPFDPPKSADGGATPSAMIWEGLYGEGWDAKAEGGVINNEANGGKGTKAASYSHNRPAYLRTYFPEPDPETFENYKDYIVSGYNGSETLVDFPVLFRFKQDEGGFDYGWLKCPNGEDMCFVDEAGNILRHEVDTWNTHGQSLVWVKVNELEPYSTRIRAYFGNANLTTNYFAREVWSAYAAVYHFNSATDATGRRYSLEAKGGATSELNDLLGVAGLSKSRSSDFWAASKPTIASITDAQSQFTVSCWAKPDAATAGSDQATRIVSWKKAENDTSGFEMIVDSARKLLVRGSGNNSSRTPKGDISAYWKAGEWAFLANVYDNATGRPFVNGVKPTVDGTETVKVVVPTASVGLGLGSYADGATSRDDRGFTGRFDEMRIYNGVESADRLKAEHDTVRLTDFVMNDGAINLDRCEIILTPPRRLWTGSKVANPSVTVRFGTSRLSEGTHYTVQYPSQMINEGKYPITVTAVDGSGYTGTVTVYFRVVKAEYSIDRLSDCTWTFNPANPMTGDGAYLVSTDGWQLGVALTEGDLTCCELSLTTAPASGVLDTTGIYEALQEGDHKTFGGVTAYTFDAPGFGAQLKKLYLDGGTWMKRLPTDGLKGGSGNLSALEELTVVSRSDLLTLETKSVTGFTSLKTVKFMAEKWTAGVGESMCPFYNSTGITTIHWNCPPPQDVPQALFKGLGTIKNYVSKDFPEWKTLDGVSGLDDTTAGTWTSGKQETIQFAGYNLMPGWYDIALARCWFEFLPASGVHASGNVITPKVTVWDGIRELGEEYDYAKSWDPEVIRDPQDYTLTLTDVAGSTYTGKAERVYTVLPPEESGLSRSDMFARTVPESEWTYYPNEKRLISSDGWKLTPEVYTTNGVKVCRLRLYECTDEAKTTGWMDLSGAYEALIAGDSGTFSVIQGYTFLSTNATTGLGVALKDLYIDGGDWLTVLPSGMLDGNRLTALTNVTIVAKGGETGEVTIQSTAISSFKSGIRSLETIRMKFDNWKQGGSGCFDAITSVTDIYWNCPPSSSGSSVFAHDPGEGIVNWVALEHPDWQSASGVSGLTPTQPGNWTSGDKEQIRFYDFRIGEGFVIILF